MASGTADLQRDLGGAIMQSILGALLTAGYASAFTKAIAASPEAAIDQHAACRTQLDEVVLRARPTSRAQYPQYASQIIAAAQDVVPRRRELGVLRRASSP